MSKDWFIDIQEMHNKYKVHPRIATFTKAEFRAFMEFRLNFLQEELNEAKLAFADQEELADVLMIKKRAEDIVDAMIDLCVVAIGTLEAFDVDAHLAWDRVLDANMKKEVGIKPSRPNPLGLPDLVKPEGWESPTHKDNVGLVESAL